MNRLIEERWRVILQDRGKDRVQAELELRPGGPEELMFGLTDQPPFPTRGFCEAWVRGKPPPSFGVSGNTAAVVGFSLLAIACMAGAVNGLTGGAAPRPRPAFSGGAAPQKAAPVTGQSDDTIGNAARIRPSGTSAGGSQGAASTSLLPECSSVTQSTSTQTVRPARPCRPAPLPSALQQGSPSSGGQR